ncbi:LysR substrate-binding domain-containing protein [Rhizobium sp. TRM96647]|uniref:LysR substrate-binding domain-containing protein n=1 Tax=unclassified Rhizobium TaxID=2613769 RepID=UPI0021E7A90F|nr:MULTISPECIES: LysR substrate-binding domain-containing protein [unclassified Rhizobium]MCV3735838.1 LysR substrate-binding domain-containing protein [Rhizobium sp. TRM96647]MCV3758500.1 LysR substrate-binding domain-containing protein [Rhizobium sp. TRM96650]
MSQPLPSLTALKAFEATVRHRSMTLAAEELFVTHGAVSRHIKGLETLLGVLLLNRNAKSTDPTPEGIQLAEGLGTAFRLIQTSIERVKPRPLTLSCSSSIMMRWIIPHISQFHELHPEIELQFNMNYDRIDFMRDKISVAIRSSTIAPPPDALMRDLAAEWIGPVCSPAYLSANPVGAPADLAEAALLATNTRPEAWQDWIAASGVPLKAAPTRGSFDHFYLLIQAAGFGLGFAVVPKMLVLDDLASGRLVAPFGFAKGPRRLVLWISPHVATRPDTLALERWLTETIPASLERADAGRS